MVVEMRARDKLGTDAGRPAVDGRPSGRVDGTWHTVVPGKGGMFAALLNPLAAHAQAAELRQVLAGVGPRLRLTVADEPAAIDGLIADLRQNPAELLVIAGGDGTVSQVLTRFARAGQLETMPPLLFLPVGRMHSIASALTGTGNPAKMAGRMLFSWGKGVRRIRRVPVIRARIGDQPDVWGVTASLGAVGRLHRDIRRQKFGARTGLGGLLAKVAVQSFEPDRFEAIVGPFDSEPEPLTLPGFTAGVMSALPGFFGMINPFPGVDGLSQSGVHAVFSELGPMATQASLPGLLLGRLGPPHVWHGELTRLAWRNGELPDVVVLDGEDLPVEPHAPVCLDATARVRMVVWRDLPLPAADNQP